MNLNRYFNAASSHDDPLIDLARDCLKLASPKAPGVAAEVKLIQSIEYVLP